MADTVTLRGVPHYYEWVKSDSSAPKPVLVFMHGWGGSARYWRNTAHILADGFDCLLYDLRGFGRSPLPPDCPLGYELHDYADDLALLLDHFEIDQITLNAHSLGASIAAVFADRHRDRLQRLILTCSGIFAYNRITFPLFHRASEYVVNFRFPWFLKVPLAEHLFMSRFLYRPLPSAVSREFLADYLDADQAAAMGTIYTAVSEQAAQTMPTVFQNIQAPTLLISGQKDQIIPPKLGRSAAALNPQITHIELAKTGHFPMLEVPDAYHPAVRAFLDLDPGAAE
jgi:pimeloyl-ACP methyl ester carboxylesterase